MSRFPHAFIEHHRAVFGRHLIEGGHFLLESALDTAVGYIRGFLGRTVAPTRAAAA